MRSALFSTLPFGPAAPRLLARAFVALALCTGLGACLEASTPPVIDAERARSRPNEVTVVEFIDYQCPFCRALDRELSPVLQQYAGRVRVVRKQVPLHRHVHARDAAKAEVCAESAGRGQAMHAALMSAPDLSVHGLTDIAGRLSLDTDKLLLCLRSRAAETRVEADEAQYQAAGGNGVPTVFIGSQRFEGVYSSDELRDAIETELRKR